MPSTTLKRTAATLGVLAGLLATAGPASAVPIHMPLLGEDGAVAGTFRGELIGLEPNVKAPPHGDVSVGITQTSRSNSLELENTMISGYSVNAAAAGTQVGSEGITDGRKPKGTYDQASPF